MGSNTLFNIGNAGDWFLKSQLTAPAQQFPDGTYANLPSFLLGANFNARLLAGAVLVPTLAKPTWRWAGTFYKAYDFPLNQAVNPKGKALSEPLQMPINKVQLLWFGIRSSQAFDIYYQPPKWFKEAEILVWAYNGTEFNFTENTLNQLEVDITDIQQDLIRIETKIDTMTNP